MKTVKKKIYYHDTDAGGVVYYSNYLKFFEEGRTEYFEEKGLFTEELLKKGIAFVVAKAEIEYKRPVRYKDIIDVETQILEIGNTSITFEQKVMKDGVLCCQAKITIVCVNENLKPVRIPDDIKNVLRRQYGQKDSCCLLFKDRNNKKDCAGNC
ncbi:MAG: acyl-CoA thioesterase [Candidatus Omnitrophica bacterium]|nr:acyl-CoA thioesterase [Candidatus Omnitrophota bacterium]